MKQFWLRVPQKEIFQFYLRMNDTNSQMGTLSDWKIFL